MATQRQYAQQLLAMVHQHPLRRHDAGTDQVREYGHSLAALFGLSFLGSGINAVVFAHPFNADLVVKVSTNYKGDGTSDYLAYCMRKHADGTAGPHLPMVHEFATGERHAVIIMERLESFERGMGNPEADALYNAWCIRQTTGLPDDVTDAVHFNDIHHGNVMLRGTTLVLTDPAYGRGAKDHAKFENFLVAGRIDVTVRVHKEKPVSQEPYYSMEDMQWHHPKGVAEQAVKRAADKMMDELVAVMGLPPHIIQHEKRKMQEMARARELWDINLRPMGEPPRILRNRIPVPEQPIWGGDFAEVERRAAAHWAKVPVWRGIKGFRADVIVADDIKEKTVARTVVAPAGSPASVRKEKEDRMLRVRSQHDHRARATGVQGVLFQGHGPRWL